MPPTSAAARQVLRAYFAEVASRYYGRPATDEEVAAAMREDPSDDLTPPGGLLLVAVQDGAVLGCAGLRLLPGGIGEITRVYVMPAARRHGLGSRLLDELETHARDHQVTTLRLDTRRDLVEGITRPVRWTATMRALAERGARRFIDAGPGQVLAKLAKRNVPGAEVRPLAAMEVARA